MNMKTIKKISCLGTALLMAASVGSAYAEDGDMTQTKERNRVQTNLQTPASDYGQAFNREETKNQHQNQNKHQYKWMNGSSEGRSGSGEGSFMSGSTNRNNMMNSYSQPNSSGFMSRQSSPARSSGGGGGRR